MEQRKRILIFVTFFTCTACLALLTASLATHKWLIARPIRSIVFNSTRFPFEDSEQPRKFRGEIYFGLFQGTKVLNYGLGDRTTIIWLKQEMSRNPNLMTFSLWLLTILAVSIAMIFGLLGAIFSIINTVMTPIETITGVQGLYLWNGLACLFCTTASVGWMIQYQVSLSRNVLTEDEQKDGWTSTGRAQLGYSYYFVNVTLLLHFANLLLIYSATTRQSGRRGDRTVIDKHPEGLIMLY